MTEQKEWVPKEVDIETCLCCKKCRHLEAGRPGSLQFKPCSNCGEAVMSSRLEVSQTIKAAKDG